MQYRSLCNTAEHPVGAVSELDAWPQCSGNGCTVVTLGQVRRLCIFTILPNQQMSQEDQKDRASLILIAPVQPWYPAMLELLIEYPLILPDKPMLLIDQFDKPHPLVAVGQLQLAAWKLSGIGSKQREFQGKLPNCWQPDGAKELTQHIRVSGGDGIAGVQNGRLIPFHVLSNPTWSSWQAYSRKGYNITPLIQFDQWSRWPTVISKELLLVNTP